MNPDHEHKFHKMGMENRLSIGFKLGPPWLGSHSHNHYIQHVELITWGDLNFYIPIHKDLEILHFPGTVQMVSQIPHPSPKAA